MVRCPKCEADLHRGTVRCPICGTPLRLRAFGAETRPDPVLDPLLSFFERDELVVYCPDCFNEFREDQKRCRHCGIVLRHDTRGAYERELQVRPIHDLGTAIAAGPPPVPRDLVRVRIVHGLAEVRHAIDELRFVGVESWAGSDTLDPFVTPGDIGVYVRAPDRESAAYVLDGLRAPDPLARPPGPPKTAREEALEEAHGWVALGKFRDALRLVEALPQDAEAVGIAALALVRAGRMREAEARALAAARTVPTAAGKGRLLFRAAEVRALGRDGTPFGEGSSPEGARALLAEAVAATPRILEIGKAHVEVLEALQHKDVLRRELHRLERMCPNLLSHDGPFRRLRESLGVV